MNEHGVMRTTGTGVGRDSPACVVGQTKTTRMSCVCCCLRPALVPCLLGVRIAVCFRVCLSLVVDACYIAGFVCVCVRKERG